MKLDHLILGISDLQKGIEDFEKLTGVRPIFAGVHPNIGTHNALISLGDGVYFEIIAPQIPNQTLQGPFRGFEHSIELSVVGWVISAPMDEVKTMLSTAQKSYTPVQRGSRKAPNGDLLQWESLFMMADDQILMDPFFITWDTSTIHPSLSNPMGCTLSDYTVAGLSDDLLIKGINHIDQPFRLLASDKSAGSLVSVGLNTPKGYVKFG